MRSRAASPVKDVSFGTALTISLNNYYDLLKTSVGGLAVDEFLQLKLVADPVALNDDLASKGGYRWWSYYNLLFRSDVAIVPEPVSGQIYTSATKLFEVYGAFLDRLIKYVAIDNLGPEDQKTLADITVSLMALRDENFKLAADEVTRWRAYADLKGYSYSNWEQYANWQVYNGNGADIAANNKKIENLYLQRKVILKKQYKDPDDEKVAEASRQFDNVLMQLAYPYHPDYVYPDGDSFSPQYLSKLAGESSAMFDSRRVMQWNLTLKDIMKQTAGGLHGSLE